MREGNIENSNTEKIAVEGGEAKVDIGYRGVAISNVTLLCR